MYLAVSICVLCALISIWARWNMMKRIDTAIKAINGMGLGIIKMYLETVQLKGKMEEEEHQEQMRKIS